MPRRGMTSGLSSLRQPGGPKSWQVGEVPCTKEFVIFTKSGEFFCPLTDKSQINQFTRGTLSFKKW
jgi:hypothetical protein